MLGSVLAVGLLGTGDALQQCGGMAPMQSVKNFLGMRLDYETADRICCHNHHWAERSGYFAEPGRDLFSKIDEHGLTTFYDSVCGLPLFVAPKERSFEEWKEESEHHGWPSFRPAELVSENVIIHSGGRMESKCGTHLGHNLPQGGVDRYCIDLVCIAGKPLTANETKEALEAASPDPYEVLQGELFDAQNYKSSAEQHSGKEPHTQEYIAGTLVVAAGLLLGIFAWHSRRQGKTSLAYQKKALDSDS